jgi:hypothetical protein
MPFGLCVKRFNNKAVTSDYYPLFPIIKKFELLSINQPPAISSIEEIDRYQKWMISPFPVIFYAKTNVENPLDYRHSFDDGKRLLFMDDDLNEDVDKSFEKLLPYLKHNGKDVDTKDKLKKKYEEFIEYMCDDS